MEALNSHFTFFLYSNVCRSLFEKDKLLFAFVLASKLQLDSAQMSPTELRFLLTGGVAMGDPPSPNPDASWITEAKWGEMCRLSALGEQWQAFSESVREYPERWKRLYDSAAPSQEELPYPWQKRLTPFQRMVVLRTVRPDKVVPAMSAFVSDALGARCSTPTALHHARAATPALRH